jgi:hypothetical protein
MHRTGVRGFSRVTTIRRFGNLSIGIGGMVGSGIFAVTGLTVEVRPLGAGLAGKRAGGGFLRNTMTRLMGLVVLTNRVQFALTGFHASTF